MNRRSFLSVPMLALLPPRLEAATSPSRSRAIGKVGAGEDREGKQRAIGLSDTTFKVLTSDSRGALFVMEQLNRRRGGPPRHLHHQEDELFFCLEGEYVVEVGDQRFRLAPGDCVLGPRGVAHAWAFSGSSVGRLLISFAPAGKMEAFFGVRSDRGIGAGRYARTAEDAAVLREFGMELIGPPIALETL
jgi:mannose-6-phosphate isomerase-like protein (cupin superfamily)